MSEARRFTFCSVNFGTPRAEVSSELLQCIAERTGSTRRDGIRSSPARYE